MLVDRLKEKVLRGERIDMNEALELVNYEDKDMLYAAANEIRTHFVGNNFDLCSITNAKSGKCSEDCKWCAQSAHFDTQVDVYDVIDAKEAVEQAQSNEKQGVHKYSLVTSGRALSSFKFDKLIGVYREVKEKTNIRLCASLGLIKEEQLKRLKEEGVEHYHCNLETARSFFPSLCTTHSYDEKVNTIKAALAQGLGVCSGGIIGMGETMAHRIELAMELQELGVKSIPINILNPIEGTPLQGTAKLTDEEVLTTIALFRFINPEAKIRFAGGRNQIKHIEKKALSAGINAALVGDLLTTIGTNVQEDRVSFQNAGFRLD